MHDNNGNSALHFTILHCYFYSLNTASCIIVNQWIKLYCILYYLWFI